MLEIENVVLKNVSYLQARDPSILAWNRHGLVRVDLAKQFGEDSGKESQETEDHIQVYLRIKNGVPYEKLYEINHDSLTCKVPDGSHALRNIKDGESMTKTYSFTKIFNPETSQIEIFNSIVKAKMLGFINGKNCTLLTYGASGSGKTFTIVGTPEEPGLIPRALEYIFRTLPKITKEPPKFMPLSNGEVKYLNQHMSHAEILQRSTILNATHVERLAHIRTYKQMQQRLSEEVAAQIDDLSNISVSIWISFAEIYNEHIYDLLQPPPARGKQRPKLRLGNSKGSCYIKDLTSINVTSGIEAYQILQYGIQNLNYAATSINSHSSRSHCIFSIKLVQGCHNDGAYMSTFNFCDLAGSERVKKTLNVGERLKESNNINTSLLVLGRCIKNIKSSQQLKDHRLVPFRESKLTQLFQRALTGLEDIMMIVNINPSLDMFDESQHVLNFSAIAKEIIVEEQPKRIRPKKANRFSQYMDGKAAIPIVVEEDEKDLEINKLKIILSDLYTEMEHEKEEHAVELSMERERIISTYKELIERITARHKAEVAQEIEQCKHTYEQKIKNLREYYDTKLKLFDESEVISVDNSSSEEDNSDSGRGFQTSKEVIKALNNTIAKQASQLETLEQELCAINVEKEKLQKEINNIPKLKERLRIMKQEEIETTVMLREAEAAYTELQRELTELEVKNKKITSEKLQLAEKVEELEEIILSQQKIYSQQPAPTEFQSELSELELKNEKVEEKLQLAEKVEELEEIISCRQKIYSQQPTPTEFQSELSELELKNEKVEEKLQLAEKVEELEEIISCRQKIYSQQPAPTEFQSELSEFELTNEKVEEFTEIISHKQEIYSLPALTELHSGFELKDEKGEEFAEIISQQDNDSLEEINSRYLI